MDEASRQSRRKPNLRLVPQTPPPVTAGGAGAPTQAEMPFAVVDGEPVTELPRDLYIPPQALEVFLEAFEGPLDLLLYLIRRQNLDILDIPIAEITRQYMQYIELMKDMQLELAGEYLVMAATLAEIKSRMLLPRAADGRRGRRAIRAPSSCAACRSTSASRRAAEDIDALERMERDVLQAQRRDRRAQGRREAAARSRCRRCCWSSRTWSSARTMFAHHHVQREPLSVRERMSNILVDAQSERFVEFVRLFDPHEGRMGVTVTFLAILELRRRASDRYRADRGVRADPHARGPSGREVGWRTSTKSRSRKLRTRS